MYKVIFNDPRDNINKERNQYPSMELAEDSIKRTINFMHVSGLNVNRDNFIIKEVK